MGISARHVAEPRPGRLSQDGPRSARPGPVATICEAWARPGLEARGFVDHLAALRLFDEAPWSDGRFQAGARAVWPPVDLAATALALVVTLGKVESYGVEIAATVMPLAEAPWPATAHVDGGRVVP